MSRLSFGMNFKIRAVIYTTLSFGAAVVLPTALKFEDYIKTGLVFYTELKPLHTGFKDTNMRVGSSQLICLEEIRKSDPRYVPSHEDFRPGVVLDMMQEVCEEPSVALDRFLAWVTEVSKGRPVEGITDTTFFDGGQFDLWCGTYRTEPSPYGWEGIDLTSLYKGHTGNTDAKLKDIGVPDTRTKPHRADHDAVLLAQVAGYLLYSKMGW